jgi:hypothetical protein
MKTAIRRPAAAASRRHGGRVAVAVACLIAVGMGSALGQTRSRVPAAVRRSRPPAGAWDRVTTDTFLPDAFSTLEGPRPAFAPAPAGQPLTDAAASALAAAFQWSTLVSADTLIDEIKDTKAAIEAACGKAGDFKGGGFETARTGFGTLAVAFGVIAAYDGDVRWKKDAATARDLFAHAGSTCAVGSDQAYAEAKARLADLAAMLDGNAPAGRPDRAADFRWSQTAGRPALMVRLEQTRDAMRPAIASPADFGRKRDALRHAVEIVAVIGEVIQQPDFADHDDDTYRGHSRAMRDAAIEARAACERDDYEAARAAVGRIEKACADCHGEYRG